jgi:hypothetical protein
MSKEVETRKKIKKGLPKLFNIVEVMLKQDMHEYKEIGKKKIGSLNIEKGLKIEFIDKSKIN